MRDGEDGALTGGRRTPCHEMAAPVLASPAPGTADEGDRRRALYRALARSSGDDALVRALASRDIGWGDLGTLFEQAFDRMKSGIEDAVDGVAAPAIAAVELSVKDVLRLLSFVEQAVAREAATRLVLVAIIALYLLVYGTGGFLTQIVGVATAFGILALRVLTLLFRTAFLDVRRYLSLG